MNSGPKLFWISGPPAAGKTTLCEALLAQFEMAVQIPVDDVRTWVCSGLADSVPWTEETELQFQLAESAACDVAMRYLAAGFAVAIDHCRNPQRLEQVIQEHLAGFDIVKVLLMPDLATNLDRSHTRTNKPFDPHMLDETIEWTNEHYRIDMPPGWTVIDNTDLTVEQTVKMVLDASELTAY